MSDNKIYIVDDEENILELLKIFLSKEGYEVHTFTNGESFLNAFKASTPNMVILDIMLPGINGLTLCREIRTESDIPIIIISAKGEDGDKISGLVLGCDDYLCKPFSPMELVLRVKSIFKRIGYKDNLKTNKTISVSDVVIDIDGKFAKCNGVDIKLTPLEFSFLLYLSENINRGVSREELLNKVWGFESHVDTRATDDMVKRIRKKLGELNSTLVIETLWGFGFKISSRE